MNLSKEEIIKKIYNKRGFLSKEYGVKNISLFGSYARDEQDEDSDVDFMVEFDSVSFDKIAGLQIYLEEIFNKKVDILRKGSRLKKRKLDIIKKEIINF